MFFCHKCNNLLDISNTVNAKLVVVDDPNKFSKMILNKNDNKIKSISFSFSDLKKNINKLSKDDKDNIIDKFNFFTKVKNKVYLVCKNCNYFEFLKNKTIVNTNILNEKEKLFIFIERHTLPRTKDYICINKDCSSHNNDKTKEAYILQGK